MQSACKCAIEQGKNRRLRRDGTSIAFAMSLQATEKKPNRLNSQQDLHKQWISYQLTIAVAMTHAPNVLLIRMCRMDEKGKALSMKCEQDTTRTI